MIGHLVELAVADIKGMEWIPDFMSVVNESVRYFKTGNGLKYYEEAASLTGETMHVVVASRKCIIVPSVI